MPIYEYKCEKCGKEFEEGDKPAEPEDEGDKGEGEKPAPAEKQKPAEPEAKAPEPEPTVAAAPEKPPEEPVAKKVVKQPLPEEPVAKKVVKRLIWNVGTALYASGRLDLFVRPFRFQNVKPFITWLPSGTLLNIIWL